MENFNSFEINAQDVIGGLSLTTPKVYVAPLTVSTYPVTSTVQTTTSNLLGTVSSVTSSTSLSLSASLNLSASTGTNCCC